MKYAGNNPLRYSKETFNLLKSMGKHICFYSNVTTRTREEVCSKLAGLGIITPKEKVYTASYMMAHYISNYYPYMKKVYSIGAEALTKELTQVGINVIEADRFNHTIENWNFLSEYSMDQDIGAVVVGFDTKFNYLKLAVSGLLLSRPDCMFFTTSGDTYDLIDGVKHPEIGTFVAAIQEFVGRSPDAVVGKPNPLMFSLLKKERPEIEKEKTCMVGDRLDTDMAFARNSGIKKMLTFSGVTQANELENLLDSDIDYFIHQIGHIYEIVKS